MKRLAARLAAISVCGILLSQCRKVPDEHRVPPTDVNQTVDTSLPQFSQLGFIGGWAYLNGGVNGLIVYRRTTDEVKAYDRQAPYRVADGCAVSVDAGETTVSDSCSGSQWSLLDGSLLKGPASVSLTTYNASISGQFIYITN